MFRYLSQWFKMITLTKMLDEEITQAVVGKKITVIDAIIIVDRICIEHGIELDLSGVEIIKKKGKRNDNPKL